MKSTNTPQDFHQDQEHHQPVESISSSSFHASTPHERLYNEASRFSWSPNNNPFINNGGSRVHQNFNAPLYNTIKTSYRGEKDDDHEEVHIPWSKNIEYDHHQYQTLIPITNQASNKSKLDLFNSFMYPKFTDMISSSHSSIEDLQHLSPTVYSKTENQFQESKLLTMNPALLASLGQPDQFQADVQFQSNSQDYSAYQGSSTTSLALMPSRGTFSQILPSVNISNLNHGHLNSVVSSLDMNVQALDLLTSARFEGGVSCHDQTQVSHAVGQQHLQLSPQGPTSSPVKLPSNNVHGGSSTYTKRLQTEPQTTKTSSKKSRTESRACPPIKVRKEKLGDRISALQQLVAPFGKTDTASVLMEAIGYIKFLQNQVETLSVPYMKSSQTRCIKPTQMVDRMANGGNGNVEESRRRDLRSRGLCLVPLSCMSYVTNDDGACGWPSSDYHCGT